LKTLDDRVRDVLRVKFLLGIFDHPYVDDADSTERIVNSAANQRVALRAARESLVLLKNERNVLPLSRDIHSIAVIGPNADDDSLTRYRYGPNGVKGITVLEGIRKKLGSKAQINYAKGCDVVDAHWPETEVLPEPLTKQEQEEINKAVDATRNSDIAVAVLGDSGKTIGESLSRTSLDLPGRQLDLVQAVYATRKPVIVVLLNGRPMSINWVNRYVPGIIEAWFPGAQGGTAIADALFGEYNPGGKLTVTFPKTVGQIPYNFPTKPNAQWEGEKTRVNGALYYFGHGLSYTTFAYSNLKISPPIGTAFLSPSPFGRGRGEGFVASLHPSPQSPPHRGGEENTNRRGSSPTVREGVNGTVSVDVTNTGSREGDEVVQLYTHQLVTTVTTYEKSLRGFERIHLKPGETKTVAFTLNPDDLALWDRNMRFVVEPGKFKVMIGSGSEDIRLTGDFEIVPGRK